MNNLLTNADSADADVRLESAGAQRVMVQSDAPLRVMTCAPNLRLTPAVHAAGPAAVAAATGLSVAFNAYLDALTAMQ